MQALKDVGFGLLSRKVREWIQEAEDPGLQEAVRAWYLMGVSPLLGMQGLSC